MTTDSAYQGRHVLITGGAGFLGSNLALRLVAEGASVMLLDSLLPMFGGNLYNIRPIHRRVTLNISDMRDAGSLERLVRGKDYIFHLAGQVSHGNSMRDPQLDLGVNCVSTMNLVEACRKYNSHARLLYTSTRQVYGRPQRLPVDEEHPALPLDVNGINKLAAEYYHLLYHQVYGLCSTVLRLTNTYGPRQRLEGNRQGVTSVFLRHALRGETLRLYGGGGQLRDFNYVDDVVEALLLAAASDACQGKVFNLGATTPCSLLEFVDTLGQFCQFAVEHVPFPHSRTLIDIGDYYGDWSRFHAVTGWQPRVDLVEGLRRTVAFYREHADHYWRDVARTAASDANTP